MGTRTNSAGKIIRWTVVPIPEGVALVAAGAEGLCAVRLGEAAAELVAALARQFPRATLMCDERALSPLAAIVADLAAGRPRAEVEAIALDINASPFQELVWRALRAIPFGETRSYGQIAAAIGAPRAARAVAGACAANPLALVIPCHRALGAHGALGGYSYGPARKRALLDVEARAVRV